MPRGLLWLALSLSVVPAQTAQTAQTPERSESAPDREPVPCTPMPVVQRDGSRNSSFRDVNSSSPSVHPLTVASLNMAAEPRVAEVVETWARDKKLDVLLLQE